MASLLKSAAQFNSSVGLYERAAVLASRAVECSERVYGPEHVRIVEALQILGAAKIERGNVDEAIAALQRARRILESIPQANPVLQAEVLASLARGQLRKGESGEGGETCCLKS